MTILYNMLLNFQHKAFDSPYFVSPQIHHPAINQTLFIQIHPSTIRMNPNAWMNRKTDDEFPCIPLPPASVASEREMPMQPVAEWTLRYALSSLLPHEYVQRHVDNRRETSFCSCWGRGFCGCVCFVSFPIHQFWVVAGRIETLRSLKFKPCLALCLPWLRACSAVISVCGSASDFRGLMRGLHVIEDGFCFSVKKVG